MARENWGKLYSDESAVFNKQVVIKEEDLVPYVTWGTNPAQSVTEKVPAPEDFESPEEMQSCQRALDYMGLKSHTAIQTIHPEVYFLLQEKISSFSQ